ncbi:unnamed protein product [Closterium sp. Yama58-4]|nr:unnamed protein product [Closterium sp. Yama58-4]
MSAIELVQGPAFSDYGSSLSADGGKDSSSLRSTDSAGSASPHPILHSQDRFLDMGAGRHGFKGASFSSAVFNLVTTVVGAGIMGLPGTMRILGIPLGIIALVAMGILTQVSLELLIKTTTVQQVWSYGDLVLQECGPKWRLVLDIAVLINNIGLCVVYLIIIADVLAGTWSSIGSAHPGLLKEWNGGEAAWWNTRFFVLVIVTLVVLIPLASFRHVDSLQYSSAIAVILAVVFVVITLVITIIKLVDGTLPSPRWLPFVSAPHFFAALCSVFPVMATAYVCHFNIHPIYVELKDRTEQNMTAVTRFSMGTCFAIYTLTSLCGYLLFGDATAPDVLANFSSPVLTGQQWLNDVVRVSYALHVVLVFPVIYYSLRNVTDDLFCYNAEKSLAEDDRRFWIITGVQLVGICLVATLVPNIWVAFDLTGATSTMVIGMVFPAVIALRDRSGVVHGWERKTSWAMIMWAGPLSSVDRSGVVHGWERKTSWAMIVWAAIICVTSIASSIYMLVVGIASQPGSQDTQG